MTDQPLPNVPLPTLGGKQLWADVFLHAGYRIQENVLTNTFRLLGPRDARLAWGSYAACRGAFDRVREQWSVQPQHRHVVLLLHGIFRAKDSFGPMQRALRAAGYEAWALNYPSTRRDLDAHAAQVERVLDHLEGVDTVSFVCHSMGGIVARVLLARDGAWRARIRPHRLVTIATPNRGAEIADLLTTSSLFNAVAGPSASRLTTQRIPEIPLPTIPFATVAGVRGDGRGYNPLLPGDDDMTVTEASVRLDGAEDHLVVNAVHTFVMNHRDVVEGTVRYLATGRFAPG